MTEERRRGEEEEERAAGFWRQKKKGAPVKSDTGDAEVIGAGLLTHNPTRPAGTGRGQISPA